MENSMKVQRRINTILHILFQKVEEGTFPNSFFFKIFFDVDYF